MADCLRCAKPVTMGSSFVSAAALGGSVHLECMTDDDMARAWPTQMVHARGHREALALFRLPNHNERLCRAVCLKFNLACPVHDREDDASEEE